MGWEVAVVAFATYAGSAGSSATHGTATGLLEAEKKFRRIKDYQEIRLLKERLNPSRIQQKEVLTAEVA